MPILAGRDRLTVALERIARLETEVSRLTLCRTMLEEQLRAGGHITRAEVTAILAATAPGQEVPA